MSKLHTCLLILPGCRPKTAYPPSRPAKKLSYRPSFPAPAGIFRSTIMDALYMRANVARLRACRRVAFKTSFVFSRILNNKAISFVLGGEVARGDVRSRSEQKYHSRSSRSQSAMPYTGVFGCPRSNIHQRMRKANFRSVDDSIACTLH